MSATNKSAPEVKPGDLVLCGCCQEKLAPYAEPYPVNEQLCSDCEAIIAEMRANGEL